MLAVMTSPVTLPLWLLLLILAFAAVTFASHFLFPSVRWFLRRRAEKVVARLNTRLTRPIEPFKLLKRQDTIQRLIYDPRVVEAVAEHARENGMREDVAFQVAHRYAREIVPSFSATTYFGVAVRLARLLARAFNRVRSAPMPAELAEALASDAALVFVMNHRSNMDYVLVIHLAAEQSTLSFAAGEWARVWPLGALVRGAGAYFVHRRSRNALYRRVMARYVQMAINGGVAQAIFPEGGLSLDGRVGLPKLGLLHYIIEDFDRENGRDVIFVPVALNYDRVLEDRVLVRAATSGKRKFRLRLRSVIRYFFRHAWQRLTGTFVKFGYAAVEYGEPLSLRKFTARSRKDPTAALGRELMKRVRVMVPITPIPLLAGILAELDGEIRLDELVSQLVSLLSAGGAEMVELSESPETEAQLAVNHFLMRQMIEVDGGLVRVLPGNDELLAYYAASIEHHTNAAAAKQSKVSATAGS